MIEVIEFTDSKFKKKGFEQFSTNKLSWVDINTPTQKELGEISKKIGIYLSDLQDSLDRFERPRITEEQNYIDIIFQTAHHENSISTLPLGIFILNNTIVTVHKDEIKAITSLKEKMDKTVSFFQKGKFFFIYRLLLEIIEEFSNTSTKIEEKLDKTEHKVYDPNRICKIEEIYQIKKSLIYFRKALESNREVVFRIEKDFLTIIKTSNRKWFRDLYTEILQVIDTEELMRARLSEAANMQLSLESNEMNKTMKRLTAYAGIIMVPTLITGLYGMNFIFMPEIKWTYGYIFALSLIFGTMFFLYFYFKRKNWL